MNAGFLNAWRLYRRGPKRPAFAGEAPRGAAAFDADVRVGEIRLFADGNRPLTALIVADCGLSGRRIVPVSPFAAPASDRELLVGARVFQLWNTTTAARRFTDRSWRVDALTAEELAEVAAAIPAARPGRLTAGDGPQARYEREFLVSAGGFIPFAAPRAARGDFRRGLFGAWGAAAGVILFFGALYLMFGGGHRRLTSAWREVALRVHLEPEGDLIALVEPESTENDGILLVHDVIALEDAAGAEIPPLPSPRAPVKGLAPASPKVDDAGVKWGAPALAEGFVRAELAPQAVLTAGGGASAAPSASGAFAYAAGALPAIERAGGVDCTVMECPWDTSHRLLNVRAAEAAGLRIEIAFDAAKVVGYRLVSRTDGGGVSAYYEIAPNGLLSALPDDAVSVTTRWCDARGERMRAETVRAGDAADFRDLPLRPRRPPDATGALSPDDVPVNVVF